MNELQPVRHAGISKRSVFVFDDLLDRHHLPALVDIVQGAGFTRTEAARPETAAYKHAVAEFDLERVRDLPIYSPTVRAIASAFAGSYLLYRAYCNAASVGDMLFTHTDCRPDQVAVTALWYLCTHWDVEWGGETLFFDETGDAGDCIAYPASMFHRVSKVTRGTRLAGVMWVQSTVRDPSYREILHELGSVLGSVRESGAAGPYTDRLHRSYWNLLRLWADP